MGTNGDESNGERSGPRPTATLLVGPGDGHDAAETLGVTVETANVLVVSATATASEVVRDWRATDASPAAFGLVTVAGFTRSAAPSSDRPSRRSVPGPVLTLTTVSDRGNLQRLGTAITIYLDDWTGTGRRTVVYVDALDPFIDATDLEAVFQFLHLLTQTVTQTGAELVVRIDTDDERAVNTLRSLFDRVVDTASLLDADEIHDLLGNPRRRFTLRSLFEASDLGLERLATRLARWENDTDDPTETEQHRAYTALTSVHVPRLAEAGVVVFDRADERVRLSDVARESDRLKHHLDD